jgi:hypothetical protein
VSFFEKIYSNQLEASITEAVTWNTGLHAMYSGKPIFPKFPKENNQRHRKVIKDPGLRKHQQTVPTMHKPKMNITPAETAVKKFGAKKVLSQDEIQKICSKYGISRLNTNNPKTLGNTGMVMKYDPSVRGYVLLK